MIDNVIMADYPPLAPINAADLWQMFSTLQWDTADLAKYHGIEECVIANIMARSKGPTEPWRGRNADD